MCNYLLKSLLCGEQKSLLSILGDIYPEKELPDHIIVLCLYIYILGTTILFSTFGCTIRYFHQQCTSVPNSSHHCQHLLFSVFNFVIANLIGVRCYLIIVLIFIHLMSSDNEHLFMCLRPFVCLFGEMSILVLCTFFS